MFCDGPPVTYFSPEFENNYENGTPGTFQTFSFGSNVCVMSSVYFVGWWGGRNPIRGWKRPIPWFSEQIWPWNPYFATPYSTTTFFFSFLYVETHWNAFRQQSPKIWCSSVTIKV